MPLHIGIGVHLDSVEGERGPPELIGDPNFNDPDYWTTSPGHTVANNQLEILNAATGSLTLRQNIVTEGVTYVCMVTITSYTEGFLRFDLGGSVEGLYNSVGTFTTEVTAGSNQGRAALRCSGTTTLNCDLFSVKEKV